MFANLLACNYGTDLVIPRSMCQICHLKPQNKYGHYFCNPWDSSLGSLEDISPAGIYRANLNSGIFFLSSFVVIYSLNETYIFFILVFLYAILFCRLLSLSLSLTLLYFLSWMCLTLFFFFSCVYYYYHYYCYLFTLSGQVWCFSW